MNDQTQTDLPALPDDVREAIENAMHRNFDTISFGDDETHAEWCSAVCAALAPHWRRMEEEKENWRKEAMKLSHKVSAMRPQQDVDNATARAEKAEAEVDRLSIDYNECSEALQNTRILAAKSIDDIREAAGAPKSKDDPSRKRAVDYVAALREKLAAAETSLAAARRDGERLDWLGSQFVYLERPFFYHTGFESRTLRAAIDSAMSADQEGKR